MKKVLFTLLCPLFLSGCVTYFLKEGFAGVQDYEEYRWTKNGYSLQMVSETLYYKCGLPERDGNTRSGSNVRAKADQCMLDRGFIYLEDDAYQYETWMHRDDCMEERYGAYNMPSCRSYRERLDKKSFFVKLYQSIWFLENRF